MSRAPSQSRQRVTYFQTRSDLHKPLSLFGYAPQALDNMREFYPLRYINATIGDRANYTSYDISHFIDRRCFEDIAIWEIPGAPPCHTSLIDEGIDLTDYELLMFYPNHCLHWPSVLLRLAQNYTEDQITQQINEHIVVCRWKGWTREDVEDRKKPAVNVDFIRSQIKQFCKPDILNRTSLDKLHPPEFMADGMLPAWPLEQVGAQFGPSPEYPHYSPAIFPFTARVVERLSECQFTWPEGAPIYLDRNDKPSGGYVSSAMWNNQGTASQLETEVIPVARDHIDPKSTSGLDQQYHLQDPASQVSGLPALQYHYEDFADTLQDFLSQDHQLWDPLAGTEQNQLNSPDERPTLPELTEVPFLSENYLFGSYKFPDNQQDAQANPVDIGPQDPLLYGEISNVDHSTNDTPFTIPSGYEQQDNAFRTGAETMEAPATVSLRSHHDVQPQSSVSTQTNKITVPNSGYRYLPQFIKPPDSKGRPWLKKATWNVQDLPPSIREAPLEIINHQKDNICGEVLLWLCHKDGGRMTLQEVWYESQSAVRRYNEKLSKGVRPISLFNEARLKERKRQALAHRAEVKTTNLETERRQYKNVQVNDFTANKRSRFADRAHKKHCVDKMLDVVRDQKSKSSQKRRLSVDQEDSRPSKLLATMNKSLGQAILAQPRSFGSTSYGNLERTGPSRQSSHNDVAHQYLSNSNSLQSLSPPTFSNTSRHGAVSANTAMTAFDAPQSGYQIGGMRQTPEEYPIFPPFVTSTFGQQHQTAFLDSNLMHGQTNVNQSTPLQVNQNYGLWDQAIPSTAFAGFQSLRDGMNWVSEI